VDGHIQKYSEYNHIKYKHHILASMACEIMKEKFNSSSPSDQEPKTINIIEEISTLKRNKKRTDQIIKHQDQGQTEQLKSFGPSPQSTHLKSFTPCLFVYKPPYIRADKTLHLLAQCWAQPDVPHRTRLSRPRLEPPAVPTSH
jgi:hypothetical protein